jgi:hypothetical protein
LFARIDHQREREKRDDTYPVTHSRAINGEISASDESTGVTRADLSLNHAATPGRFRLSTWINGGWRQEILHHYAASEEGLALPDAYRAMARAMTATNRDLLNRTRERDAFLVGAVNHAWADRYLLHLSYRLNNHSFTGTRDHRGSFWAVGAGWNLHQEPFLAALADIG